MKKLTLEDNINKERRRLDELKEKDSLLNSELEITLIKKDEELAETKKEYIRSINEIAQKNYDEQVKIHDDFKKQLDIFNVRYKELEVYLKSLSDLLEGYEHGQE